LSYPPSLRARVASLLRPLVIPSLFKIAHFYLLD